MNNDEIRLLKAEITGMQVRHDNLEQAVHDDRMRAASMTIWLVVLTVTALVEAIAIGALWWFR